MNTSTIAIAVAVVLAGLLIAAGRRGNGNVVAGLRFLFDPNKEPAASAPAVADPGRRTIVSMTAAGDYHREEAVDRQVMIQQAYARSESDTAFAVAHANRMSAIMAMAANQPASKPRIHEVERIVVHREPVYIERPAKADEKAGEKKADEGGAKDTAKPAGEKKSDEGKGKGAKK